MVWYYKFCCSVHYFFERRMKYEDAEIFTFFFMLVLIQLNVFSIIGVLGILFHEKTVLFNKYDQPILFIMICLINYLISFRRLRYLNYEKEKLNGLSAFIVIVLTYAIFGVTAYFYKNMFFRT
jgi:hypothetical protein